MSGMIPQGFIDDLLARTDIVEVVSDRVKLKKAGKNHVGLCPFHNEKTPSFSVSSDKQFFYCFGCGAGGNALGFLMDHDRLEFPEAVEELARRAGVDVPREERRPGQNEEPRRPARDNPLFGILEQAGAWYRQQLRQHPARQQAVDYLRNRGLSGEIARDFGIGYAPPGWDNLLRHLSNDHREQQLLIDAGLVLENEETGRRYDRFRERIMFPIRDSRGRVIGFGGRVLGDDKPKYLNSPETELFHKGRELYGLYEARQRNRQLEQILVTEGYMDVIALAQHGINNAVATLGTATSEEHLRLLFRSVTQIVFCFDGDKAGRQAAWRALHAALGTLEDGRQIRFLFLPDGQDPDSLVRSEGSDAFRKRLLQAEPLTDYLFRHLTEECPPSTLEGKAQLASEAMPLVAQVPGNMLRRLMVQALERITGMPLDDPGLQRQPRPTPQPAAVSGSEHTSAAVTRQRTQPAPGHRHQAGGPELEAARILLHCPQLARQISNQQHLPSHTDNPAAQLLVALINTLRHHPQMSTVQLLARWHGTEMGEQLTRLSEQEWLLHGNNSNLQQQLQDTLERLHQLERERQLQQLLDKAAIAPLEADEKQQLRDLLQQRNTQKNDD
ncbi:DNA primase [Halopseudomonas yangmingensis]|uniref:DNA primase n=1 Tax=Halopseudomonas yangmingensis TaxID=1720063 RepID=A0A1I4PCP5_9GAMM|nr:DNA primase [Halopseudomonas yangmingensis]SFM25440.1 DNA primase [Halopseudomonas yangmingensis]